MLLYQRGLANWAKMLKAQTVTIWNALNTKIQMTLKTAPSPLLLRVKRAYLLAHKDSTQG